VVTFFTVINCMDGIVQLPVIEYIKNKFDVLYVDKITDPGPNLILSEQSDTLFVESIFNRIYISVYKHFSVGISIAAHHDCAGNPSNDTEQKAQLVKAVKVLKDKYPEEPVYALWLDENFKVHEVA
jgi:hypothetical protein